MDNHAEQARQLADAMLYSEMPLVKRFGDLDGCMMQAAVFDAYQASKQPHRAHGPTPHISRALSKVR